MRLDRKKNSSFCITVIYHANNGNNLLTATTELFLQANNNRVRI